MKRSDALPCEAQEERRELRACAAIPRMIIFYEDTGKYVEIFLPGDRVHFVATMPKLQKTSMVNIAALPEHSRVHLLHSVPKANLASGVEGTIVHVYEDGGYEVEFIVGLKRPVVLTLEEAEIEAVNS